MVRLIILLSTMLYLIADLVIIAVLDWINICKFLFYYLILHSQNDVIPRPNYTHTMPKIRRAQYVNASSIAEKLLYIYELWSCPLPILHLSNTWSREWASGNEHRRGWTWKSWAKKWLVYSCMYFESTVLI